MEVTKAKAAQLLGVSIDEVLRRIKRGELQARKKTPNKFSDWVITLPDGASPVKQEAKAEQAIEQLPPVEQPKPPETPKPPEPVKEEPKVKETEVKQEEKETPKEKEEKETKTDVVQTSGDRGNRKSSDGGWWF